MSFATLERAILANAKVFFKNPKLRLKDLQEWSTGKIEPESAEEIVAFIPDPGVYVAILAINDKRTK